MKLDCSTLKDVLDYDVMTGRLIWRRRMSSRAAAGQEAGAMRPDGYRCIRVYGVTYLAHRLVWLWVSGEWPGSEIDHRNGVRHDNRLDNLRAVTRGENALNLSLRGINTSGCPGVGFHKRSRRWRARITINRREVALGYFRTKGAAIAARKTAERLYFGAFRRGD